MYNCVVSPLTVYFVHLYSHQEVSDRLVAEDTMNPLVFLSSVHVH